MKRGIHSSTAGATFSDLFRYDLATDSWTQLTGDSTPRARHAAVSGLSVCLLKKDACHDIKEEQACAMYLSGFF